MTDYFLIGYAIARAQADTWSRGEWDEPTEVIPLAEYLSPDFPGGDYDDWKTTEPDDTLPPDSDAVPEAIEDGDETERFEVTP